MSGEGSVTERILGSAHRSRESGGTCGQSRNTASDTGLGLREMILSHVDGEEGNGKDG